MNQYVNDRKPDGANESRATTNVLHNVTAFTYKRIKLACICLWCLKTDDTNIFIMHFFNVKQQL